MNGLPQTSNLDSLIGVCLVQICIGEHQAILKFDNEIRISIESKISVNIKGYPPGHFEDYGSCANQLCDLIGSKICEFRIEVDGGLKLGFTGDSVIYLINGNCDYESFQVQIGESVLVA